jgi:hypothetical protein
LRKGLLNSISIYINNLTSFNQYKNKRGDSKKREINNSRKNKRKRRESNKKKTAMKDSKKKEEEHNNKKARDKIKMNITISLLFSLQMSRLILSNSL